MEGGGGREGEKGGGGGSGRVAPPTLTLYLQSLPSVTEIESLYI